MSGELEADLADLTERYDEIESDLQRMVPKVQAVMARIEQAADEASNVEPDDETWSDDQKHAVEVFAQGLLKLVRPDAE